MKALTTSELQTLVDGELGGLVGSQFQEIRCFDRGLALGLWASGLRWLIIDLAPNAPVALVFSDPCPLGKSGRMKPLGLFLRSHGRGRRVRQVEWLSDQGRVIRILFGEGPSECSLEIQLVPKQANLHARSEGKEVYWNKPKELGPPPVLTGQVPVSRSPEELRAEWLRSVRGGGAEKINPEEQWRRKIERDLEKKRKALAELERQLAEEGEDWAARGEAFKSGTKDWIDESKGLAWNIEEAFRRARQSVAKKEGREKRRGILLTEIEALATAQYPGAGGANSGPVRSDLMAQAGARGRKLALSDGKIAWMGRSAADNLALLRKARGWDLWLHLRDYPGAHAVIQRNRGQAMSSVERDRVAGWLAEESLGSRARGQRLEVVMTECRFVRPIKGDKMGRVNYQNEVHFFVQPDGSPP